MWYRVVSYNAGSRNLSFNVFDISVYAFKFEATHTSLHNADRQEAQLLHTKFCSSTLVEEVE